MSASDFNARARQLESKGSTVYYMGSLSDILVEGSAGFEVEELQRYLQGEGFYTSSYGITGYFGPVTKQAVIKWQKANGVLPTGNFGGMSRAKYLELQESKVGKSKRGSIFNRKKKKEKEKGKVTSGSVEKGMKTKSRSFDAKTNEAVVSIVQPSQVSQVKSMGGKQGFRWGTTLMFFVTLVVCWQTFTMYYRKKQERDMERRTLERDRAVQVSRWMRTIDTDRRS